MNNNPSIITVSLSPAWDITCYGKKLEWGAHQHLNNQTITPAGKALNVSKALSWMGQRSIAAGLWGESDYTQMQKAVESSWPLIANKMTSVCGQTRLNITIIDTENNREMHLRNKNKLSSPEVMEKLNTDLKKNVNENSICVFAGAMPEDESLNYLISIIQNCHKAGARIVLDTSGPALKKIADTGLLWVVKPNIFELGELLGQRINDNTFELIEAGKQLLGTVENLLISRGARGAIAISKQASFQGRCIKQGQVLCTVGCGDYLLAGFLGVIVDTPQLNSALETALKAASAKAWGWAENKKWQEIERDIEIDISEIK